MNGIAEAQREDCFLCAPNEQLVYHRGSHGYAQCGLGPQVPGYTVVGTINHMDALTEMNRTDLRSHLDYVEFIRGALIAHYGGPCLVTEHGKTPLCNLEFMRTAHCYHPHALLFPGMPVLDGDPRDRYGEPTMYSDFCECITATGELDQYFLLSARPGEYLLWPTPGDMPAQYARYLVGTHLRQIEQVSWRKFHAFDAAVGYAQEMRTALGQGQSPTKVATR